MNPLDSLARASLFGLAALAIALGLQWLLTNRVPASWRVWIWRVALIQSALALIPLAPIALAVLPASAPIEAPTLVDATLVDATLVDATLVERTLPTPSINATPQTLAEAPPLVGPSPQISPQAPAQVAGDTLARSEAAPAFDWRALIIAVYALGIGVQFAILARNARRVRRTLRACTPLDDAPLRTGLLRAIAARLHVANLPRLLQSDGGSPFLVGILRPAIVVPRTLNGAHLEAVLAHELAHHKRRDLAWNALLWALQTLLWFHPLTFAARRFHALEVESACDELTLQLTRIAPKSYGALLITSMNKHSSPLTAGVNDGFFALKTRLKRLGRAPKSPRKRVGWLFGAALLVSFGAIVPLRLVSRAQTDADAPISQQLPGQAAPDSRDIAGVLLDYQNQPVAGATVWAIPPMPTDKTLAQTRTDAKGKFRLPEAHIVVPGGGRLDMELFVDAGARGVGSFDVSGDASPMQARLTAPAKVTVRLVDEKNQALPDVEVRVRAVGDGIEERTHQESPPEFYRKFRATTDARGEATFSGLPAGGVAHLVVEGQSARDLKDFVKDDWRGGRFAPLSDEDAVTIQAPTTRKTIRLLAPVRLEGRVLQPDGSGRANIKIGARRLSTAQIAGEDKSRAGVVYRARTDAKGRYSLDGLRPGRYHVWVAPNPQLTQTLVGPEVTRELSGETTRVDLPLSRGALIQGVVVARPGGQPVKGQTMGLIDSQGSYRYDITDARGFFKFRVVGGAQKLWIHANGTNSPPPGFKLPAKNEFDFTLKDGQKREFRLELTKDSLAQPVQIRGVVLGPEGQSAAGARVVYRAVGTRAMTLNAVPTDARGRFRFTLKAPARVAQMWAQQDDKVTPLPTLTVADREARLQMAKNGWSQLAGRVTDESGQPVAGASVERVDIFETTGMMGGTTLTDARGNYRFTALRPGLDQVVRVTKTGYGIGSGESQQMVAGQTRRFDITLRRAPATLAGIVTDDKGQPARGYVLGGTGQLSGTKTGLDGRFIVPQMFVGQQTLFVWTPDFKSNWRVPVRGGDQNVKIRLNAATRSRPQKIPQSATDPALLVGKTAPPLAVSRWSNGKALALDKLRGQTVVLTFDNFIKGRDGGMRDFARSFPKVQVIGVQTVDPDLAKYPDSPLTTSADEAAQSAGFPVAVDQPLPKGNTGWRTAKAYGNVPYVAIGPNGRVRYAGHQLDRALAQATSAGEAIR